MHTPELILIIMDPALVAEYQQRIAALTARSSMPSSSSVLKLNRLATGDVMPWAQEAAATQTLPRDSSASLTSVPASLRSMPALFQLHQDIRSRTEDRAAKQHQHVEDYSAQQIHSSSGGGTSALELVQGILSMAQRRSKSEKRDHLVLLPSERYELHNTGSSPARLSSPVDAMRSTPPRRPSSTPTSPQVTATQVAAPGHVCPGCVALTATVDHLRQDMQRMEETQNRLLSAMLNAATRADSTFASSSVPMIEHVEAAWDKGALSAGGRAKEDSSHSITDVLKIVTELAGRVSQVETDLDVTVTETQKLEKNILGKVQAVDHAAVKRTDFAALASDWYRLQRHEGQELALSLCRALGVEPKDIDTALSQDNSVSLLDRMWADSNVARSLRFVHAASASQRSASTSTVNTQSLGGAAAMVIHAGELGSSSNRSYSDAIGPLPLHTRMLGLELVDEPFSSGVRIRHVIPGSTSATGGLRSGEYIVSINRMPTRTTADVIQALATVMPGAVLAIKRITGASGRDEELVQVVAGSRRIFSSVP